MMEDNQEGTLFGFVVCPPLSKSNPSVPDLGPVDGMLWFVCAPNSKSGKVKLPTLKTSRKTTPFEQYPLPKHDLYVYPSTSCAVLDALGLYFGPPVVTDSGSKVEPNAALTEPESPRNKKDCGGVPIETGRNQLFRSC